MDSKIGNIRKNIDRIDKDIISLLEKRIGFVNQIGHLKSLGEDVSYIKADREYMMIKSLSDITTIPKKIILQIWRNIISYSLYSEKKYKICFLGDQSEFQKSYYLIRMYFSSLPSITNLNNYDEIDGDASNIVIAEAKNIHFIEFLYRNRGFKVFAKLSSEVGGEYYAAAKIPVQYLASLNFLYLVPMLAVKDVVDVVCKIDIEGRQYVVAEDIEAGEEGVMLGSYAQI